MERRGQCMGGSSPASRRTVIAQRSSATCIGERRWRQRCAWGVLHVQRCCSVRDSGRLNADSARTLARALRRRLRDLGVVERPLDEVAGCKARSETVRTQAAKRATLWRSFIPKMDLSEVLSIVTIPPRLRVKNSSVVGPMPSSAVRTDFDRHTPAKKKFLSCSTVRHEPQPMTGIAVSAA